MVFILPFASVGMAYLFSLYVFRYITLPSCYLYELTGIYCPGCGCTRAVYALIHGDVILSLKQNPLVIVSLAALFVLYIELVFRAFGKKLRGFDDPDAVLTAPETRSSSPVRIVRGPDRCSTGVPGLYPCGEGAGYAGGITSAAVDGLRCAESVIAALQNEA